MDVSNCNLTKLWFLLKNKNSQNFGNFNFGHQLSKSYWEPLQYSLVRLPLENKEKIIPT